MGKVAKKVIAVRRQWWLPYGDERYCYRAYLAENPEYHDVGLTKRGAVTRLLWTLGTFGFSNELCDYRVKIVA